MNVSFALSRSIVFTLGTQLNKTRLFARARIVPAACLSFRKTISDAAPFSLPIYPHAGKAEGAKREKENDRETSKCCEWSSLTRLLENLSSVTLEKIKVVGESLVKMRIYEWRVRRTLCVFFKTHPTVNPFFFFLIYRFSRRKTTTVWEK